MNFSICFSVCTAKILAPSMVGTGVVGATLGAILCGLVIYLFRPFSRKLGYHGNEPETNGIEGTSNPTYTSDEDGKSPTNITVFNIEERN